MRTPPLLADFIHHRVCKPICEKLLTLPIILPLGKKRSPTIGHSGGGVHFLLLINLLRIAFSRVISSVDKSASSVLELTKATI